MTRDEWRDSRHMSKEDWLASTDPWRMIDWAEIQGYGPLLWDFAISCARRIWNELPGNCRRVVEHFEQLGLRGIEDPLHEACKTLDKLTRRLQNAESSEESRLNRKIGYGKIIW